MSIRIDSNKPQKPSEVGADLSNLADHVYLPTNQDRKLKSEFWAKSRDTLALQVQGKSISLSQVLEFVSTPKVVAKQWSVPGFKEWFCNGDEQRQKLEYLYDLSLDAAEGILRDPDPKTSSAKVNLIKVLAELAKKYPRQAAVDIKSTGDLSAEELRALLKEQGIEISVTNKTTYTPIGAEVLDVTPSKGT